MEEFEVKPEPVYNVALNTEFEIKIEENCEKYTSETAMSGENERKNKSRPPSSSGSHQCGEQLQNEDDVFKKFKNQFQVSLPNYIENLLKFSGFDNFISISSIDENDLEQIENIARNQIVSLFPGNSEDYLGCFKFDAMKFFIAPGQKKLIYKIKQFCQELSNKRITTNVERGTQTTPLPSCHQKNRKKKPASPEVSQDLSMTSSEIETTLKANINSEENELGCSGEIMENRTWKNVSDSEKEDILKRTIRWTEDYLHKNISDNDAILVKMLREVQNITIEFVHNKNSCSIRCPVCAYDSKNYRATTGTWLLSNYHRHFKTHISELKGENDGVLKRYKRCSVLPFLQKNKVLEDTQAKSSVNILQNIVLSTTDENPEGNTSRDTEFVLTNDVGTYLGN